MKKTVLFAMLLASSAASAAVVSADDARAAVGAWMREGGGSLGSAVASVETVAASGVAMHVASLEGGGFVVAPTDDRIEPVVMYSSAGTLVRDERNPLWALLKGDLAYRAKVVSSLDAKANPSRLSGVSGPTGLPDVAAAAAAAQSKWARLLKNSGGSADAPKRLLSASSSGVSSISDIRVAPLTSTTWNQGDVGGRPCYNYYTPSNYVCGCVATATAQIMRYFRFPTSEVQRYSRNCTVNGVETKRYTMFGGVYNWDLMPVSPVASSMTDPQRMEIGKLTFDVGVSVGMAWATNGSSSATYFAGYQMVNVFGYAGMLCDWFLNGRTYSLDAVKASVIPNCDAGLPVMMALPGHAVYVDGYGYEDGVFYMHMNAGWGGADNAWYTPPNFTTSSYIFNGIEGFVCNISTNKPSSCTLVSGRVLSSSGTPVPGAAVTAKRSGATVAEDVADGNGIYAFFVSPGNYTLSASYGSSSVRSSVDVKSCKTLGQNGEGSYWLGTSYASMNNNLYDQDLTLSNVASVEDPVFSPAGGTFNEPQTVTISCATSGATIRYTTDGTDPDESSSAYVSGILIEDGCTLKARAFKAGMSPSLVVSATYVISGLAAALDTPNLVWTTSGDWTWTAETTNTHDGIDAAMAQDFFDRSSMKRAEMQTTITGSAMISFYYWTLKNCCTIWCEVDGTSVWSDDADIANAGWQKVSLEIDGDGDHVFRIGFKNSKIINGVEYYGGGWTINGSSVPNQAVVDQFVVTYPEPQYTATTNAVAVPFAWMDAYYPGQASGVDAYTALAERDTDGDGYSAWAEYLAGTDPTNALSFFYATIRMEGTTPVVEYAPTNNTLDGIIYSVVGSPTVNGSYGETNASSRFFKVRISKSSPGM